MSRPRTSPVTMALPSGSSASSRRSASNRRRSPSSGSVPVGPSSRAWSWNSVTAPTRRMPSTTAIAAAGGGTAAKAPPAQMSMSAAGAACLASKSRHCRSRRPRAARSAARRRRAPSPARSLQGDSRRFRSRSASENGSDRMALQRAISSTCPGSSSARAGTRAASAETRWPTPPVGVGQGADSTAVPDIDRLDTPVEQGGQRRHRLAQGLPAVRQVP